MAASAPILDEFEDIFTCSVCLEIFNNEAHQPKFLSCYHSLCLECIKAMATHLMVLICPICRKETPLNKNDKFDLPNNHYILEMMASKRPQKPIPSQSGSPQPAKEHWCMKCRKEPSNLCSLLTGHSIISIGENYSESNCIELQKIMDNNESQLRNIIEKRMDAKNNYNLIYTALKVMEDAVKNLEEENDLRIVEIVSLLESPETLIGKEANVQSLARKVQKETENVKKELMDFFELERTFFGTIRDPGLHPIGKKNEAKMTCSVASEILLTLIKSGIIKSNEINTAVKIPPPKPNRKPKLNEPLRFMDSTSSLSKFSFQTDVAYSGNGSTNSQSSISQVGVPLKEASKKEIIIPKQIIARLEAHYC